MHDPVTPTCRLCGSTDVEPGVARERGWTYHRCAACAFLFLHPAPTAGQLDAIYNGCAGHTFHRGADRALAYERRLEARLRYATIERHLKPGARIVELGCGGGHFLAVARDAGHPVVGFELGDDPVAFAREEFGLDVRRGTLDGDPEPADVLIGFNVLSHLPEPEETLGVARRWLRPGGLLVLETGNVGELAASRYPPLGAPEHIFHYGEPSLRALLDRCGYQVAGIDRRNVEWQRAMLAAKPKRSSNGAPRRRPWRRPLSWLLLTARFRLGRFNADARHFCTLFVFARPT